MMFYHIRRRSSGAIHIPSPSLTSNAVKNSSILLTRLPRKSHGACGSVVLCRARTTRTKEKKTHTKKKKEKKNEEVSFHNGNKVNANVTHNR